MWTNMYFMFYKPYVNAGPKLTKGKKFPGFTSHSFSASGYKKKSNLSIVS